MQSTSQNQPPKIAYSVASNFPPKFTHLYPAVKKGSGDPGLKKGDEQFFKIFICRERHIV